MAVTGQKNTNWYTPSSNFSVQTDGEGTILENTSTNILHYWVNNYSQINIGAFAVEFDLISYNNAYSGIRISGTNSHQIHFQEVNCPQNCHFKLIIDGTKIKYQINDGTIVDFVTTSETTFYVGFRFVQASNLKYKNFVVYPI